MPWDEWIRTVEIEPSIYAADFANLGEQLEVLLRTGARVFHFDVGDGHFVPPVTMGPIVLESISPLVHQHGGVLDCHLMVEEPEKHFAAVAAAGGDSVTFHYEAVFDVAGTIRAARQQELQVGMAFNPETEPETVAAVASGVDLVLCMSIHPGYSGQEFMPESLERIARLRAALPCGGARAGGRRDRSRERALGVRGRGGPDRLRGVDLLARGSAARLPAARPRAGGASGVSLERALELAERGRGTTHPNPVVGAVVVSGGEVVGEGWHERKGGPHAEVVALEAAGERARGATVYVTLEPCSHHGATPPCSDALIAAGVAKVVVGAEDPNPEVDGIGALRAAGIEVEVVDSFEARAQNEAWRTWIAKGRPFVTYKAAVTLDGRTTLPGSRWITGEASRRLVHELRAASDAVAVGMGTVRADEPRLDARDVPVVRQPRRLAFGRGPLPAGSELELRSGPLEEELAALAAEGVQSLLLEGGPTLASSFLAADLVDKLLLFVAPVLGGAGAGAVSPLPDPVALSRLTVRQVGEDALLEAYVHEP